MQEPQQPDSGPVLSPRGMRVGAYEDERDGSFLKYILAVALIAALLGGGYYYFSLSGKVEAIPASVVIRMDERGRSYIDMLNAEPCNRPVAENLAGYLVRRAEFSSAISFIRYVETKCGHNDELMTALLLAQKGSSDFTGAEKTATKLLDDNPGSAYGHVWRSEIREELGNYQGAYEDLKKGIYLFPDPSQVVGDAFYRLAKLAVKIEKPCEAVAIMQDYVAFDHMNRRTPQVIAAIEEWQALGHCPPPFGKGTVRLHYNPGGPAIIMPVAINGVRAQMVIDTGATYTVITKKFAERAGIAYSADKGSLFHTANGKVWSMAGRAKTISLEGASTQNVPLFIQGDEKGFGNNIDGLLGLSFLGNFKFSMHNGVLELKPLN